jgi:predicted ATP-grasp superfamily ATP-dependent carboligase
MAVSSNRVLVTYGWVRSSYVAVRNLVEHGVDVIVADSNGVGMCQWSKYPTKCLRYTSHYEDERQFIDDIKRICAEEKVGLIMASHNETEILAQYRDEFPEALCALLPNAEQCAVFNNKARSYELARDHGVPVPERIEYQDPLKVADAVQQHGASRVVVKLLLGNSAKGIFYADSPAETQTLVGDLIQEFELPADRFPQIEDCVDGDGCGCSSFFWHGQPIASFCHRRLREKTQTGGTSTYRESIENEALVAYSNKLLSEIGWHGFAMVEYKMHPETGKIWFIEVNPRLWGSLHLSVASGFEFPYLAWLCATEGPDAAIAYHASRPKHIGHRARWLLGDLIIAVGQLTRGQFSKAWTTLFRQPADSYDDWNVKDLGAFAGELAFYGSSFIRNRSSNPVEKGMIG